MTIHRSMYAKIVFVLILAIGTALCAVNASAQRYLGSIEGEVVDATGAILPGVIVTAEESGTHFKTQVTTNSSGPTTLPR
jgi:hypothetical protein